MSKEFKRQDYMRHLRLGKKYRRVSWRKPKGIHSKMRLGRVGYPKSVKIGYKSPRIQSGKINDLIPHLIHNVAELSSLAKNNLAIIARVGARKKLAIIKKAEEMKIKILNLGGRQ